MQFIDGRLDLLNSGEGFSDVFEEEINMGEYAGEPRVIWSFYVVIVESAHRLGISELTHGSCIFCK